MNFTPSLRRLLQLRRSLARQEEMKMALLSSRVHALEEAQSQGRATAQREEMDLQREMLQEASGAELQAAGLRHAVEEERQQRLRDEAQRAAAAQSEQRKILLQRTRERETLATLDAQFAMQQRREQQRREQAALDEGFLLSRAWPQDGED